MNKIYTNDLNKISVPASKANSFEHVKKLFDFYKISTPIDYVSFDDSKYDIIVGCHFNLSQTNDPVFEFCFLFDEVMLLYFREAI